MTNEEPTSPGTPNALELLKQAHSMLSDALSYSAESRNALVKVLSLIEQVQDELRHGIDRALVPLRRQVDDHERRLGELESKEVA